MLLGFTRTYGLYKLAVWVCLLLALLTGQAFAYVGPGLGAGALASVLGIFASIVMLTFGAIWYPIKKIIKRYVFKTPINLRNADGAAEIRN
jgi:hypothetical protein